MKPHMPRHAPRAFWLGALLGLCALMLATPACPAATVKDMAGRMVSLPETPRRVVGIGPSCLRLIVYLQAQDLVVGVEDMEKKNPEGRPYWLAHPRLASLPTVGPGGAGVINKEPDLEAILAVQPQVVLVANMDPDLADRVQQRLGIPVVVLDFGAFATFDTVIYDSLRLAGQVLGRVARAQAVVDFLEAARADLKARAAGLEPGQQAQAYVGGIGYRGEHGLESTFTDYMPFAWAGVDNLAAAWGPLGHLLADRERVLALDPPVIFVDGGGLARVGEDAAKRPGYYRSLRAFQQGQVYLLHPFNWYATNLGTALADAYAIGKILYPQRYADLDPERKADEIYAFLVGQPVQQRMTQRYGKLGGRVELPGLAGGN